MSDKSVVAIIDYGSGNLRSAAKAFERVIAENNLEFDVLVTNKATDVLAASHIVLPGQGAFGDCMSGLSAVEGMIAALEEAVIKQKKPFLGICVGMQLLATKGFEYGEHDGLGWIEGNVVPIKNDPKKPLKIPHMGWNDVHFCPESGHVLTKKFSETPRHFYFVHSFMFESKNKEHVLAKTRYGGDIAAVVGRDNIIGVQFHPEKSQAAGLEMLRDFLLWQGH